MSRVKFSAILALAFVASIMAPAARAVDYVLNVDYCTTGCLFGGTGGVVSVTSDGTTTDVKLTLNAGFSLDGNAGNSPTTFSFNNTSSALLVTDFTIVNAAGTNWAFEKPASNSDGAGSFGYGWRCTSGVQGNDCQNGSNNIFEFQIATSKANVASFNVLSTGGSPSAFFAVNVDNPINGACTGVIGSDGTGVPKKGGSNNGSGVCSSAVPEPTSIAFFGTGLVGLGIVLRRKFARS